MTIELDHGSAPGPSTVDQVAVDQVALDVVQAVAGRASSPVDAVQVRELVQNEWARYSEARVRTFIPVLVRRAVIGQLISRQSIAGA